MNRSFNFECGMTTVRELLQNVDDNTVIEVYIAGNVKPIPVQRGYKNEFKEQVLDSHIFCDVRMNDNGTLEIVL